MRYLIALVVVEEETDPHALMTPPKRCIRIARRKKLPGSACYHKMSERANSDKPLRPCNNQPMAIIAGHGRSRARYDITGGNAGPARTVADRADLGECRASSRREG